MDGKLFRIAICAAIPVFFGALLVIHHCILSGEIPIGPALEDGPDTSNTIKTAESLLTLITTGVIGLFAFVGLSTRDAPLRTGDGFVWSLLVLFIIAQIAGMYSIYAAKLDIFRLTSAGAIDYSPVNSWFGWAAFFMYGAFCLAIGLSLYVQVTKTMGETCSEPGE